MPFHKILVSALVLSLFWQVPLHSEGTGASCGSASCTSSSDKSAACNLNMDAGAQNCANTCGTSIGQSVGTTVVYIAAVAVLVSLVTVGTIMIIDHAGKKHGDAEKPKLDADIQSIPENSDLLPSRASLEAEPAI